MIMARVIEEEIKRTRRMMMMVASLSFMMEEINAIQMILANVTVLISTLSAQMMMTTKPKDLLNKMDATLW